MATSPSALPSGAPGAAASPPRGPRGQRRASHGTLTCEHLVGPSRMAREMSWLRASPCWPYPVPTGHGALCAGGGPGRRELFFSSLAPSHKKPRALPGRTPLAPLRKTLSQAHGCLAILAFPLYGSNWQHLSLRHSPLTQETVRRAVRSPGRLAEEVSRELPQLLGRRSAGLFPAWMKRAASSREEAHKGKKCLLHPVGLTY